MPRPRKTAATEETAVLEVSEEQIKPFFHPKKGNNVGHIPSSW